MGGLILPIVLSCDRHASEVLGSQTGHWPVLAGAATGAELTSLRMAPVTTVLLSLGTRQSRRPATGCDAAVPPDLGTKSTGRLGPALHHVRSVVSEKHVRLAEIVCAEDVSVLKFLQSRARVVFFFHPPAKAFPDWSIVTPHAPEAISG